MNLEGKNAIVTGGSRGIGKAIAHLLASRGANVLIAARQLDQARLSADEISLATQRKVAAKSVDVADFESVLQMTEFCLDEFGKIDILVNNAGLTRDNLIMRISDEDWDLVLDVNLKGAFNCSKAVIRSMIKQRSGRIVNISSVSGLAGNAGQTNYSASKAGLVGLTKSLAREVASRGITVNVIAPGFIPTDLTNDIPDSLKAESLKVIPLGRWGEPEEIAFAVAFLASDEAGYITGQVLSVDGGMTMM